MIWCTADQDLHWHCQKYFHFSFFALVQRPLLVDVDIYTTTLILYSSLNYNLIDTKLGTLVHLLIFYQPSKLAMWPEKIDISVACTILY